MVLHIWDTGFHPGDMLELEDEGLSKLLEEQRKLLDYAVCL